jgi:hypothetical protein
MVAVSRANLPETRVAALIPASIADFRAIPANVGVKGWSPD